MKQWLGNASVISAVALVGVGIWYLAILAWDLPPALLPTPLDCVWAGWSHRDDLLRGLVGTGVPAVVGLFVSTSIGILVGIAFCLVPWLRRAMFPYVMFLQTVPVVAIAPLLIIWSGYTFRTVAIVTAIVSLFPIINAMTAGLARYDREAADLFSLYRVNSWQRLIKLQLPASVRDLIVGLKSAVGLSVIGAIVAEFFVGNGTQYDGLGTLMDGWRAMGRTDALIAAIFISTLLGLGMFGVVVLIERTLLRRWR